MCEIGIGSKSEFNSFLAAGIPPKFGNRFAQAMVVLLLHDSVFVVFF